MSKTIRQIGALVLIILLIKWLFRVWYTEEKKKVDYNNNNNLEENGKG